jgi:cholesterol transport system auxiliary component
MRRGISIVVAVGMILGGCAFKEMPPIRVYTIQNSAVTVSHSTKYRQKILQLSYPRALSGRATDQMHYSYSSMERGTYQNARWENTLPRLLQGTLVAALQQSRIFKAVFPETSAIREDLRLESLIYDFSHHIRGGSSYAAVSIRFALLDAETGALVKTKRFTYSEKTTTCNAQGYVEAVNRIMKKLTADLIMWLQ